MIATIDHLLTQPVTIYHRVETIDDDTALVVTDDFNSPELSLDAGTPAFGYMESSTLGVGGDEFTATSASIGRDERVLYLRADVTIELTDVIEHAGVQYEVTAPPDVHHAPGDAAPGRRGSSSDSWCR